ncbi:uncharacterized protein HMPREF1541_00056 [Cyphellophora europaea CBS 101466]|uniref:Lipocalin-like domain-containing protein n=1 Tax=Cyphellophora europaea (strain CBS 101466) TaxID=1220924 RepID=W2SBA0_CYPE1|nr:uncharacterized protein HMPREF1541_00056 [Cyphellophora europaea CBS 101466]ETN45875.1 hypothetical protein HMPREF1541_00056 [Cyphellophora europaea CBS 101466]
MSAGVEREDLWLKYATVLVGGWRCTSYHMYSTDDPDSQRLISKPHGDDPLGRVMISPKGYLSAHIARRERMGPLPSGKQWIVGEDSEVAHVARGLSMYCGYVSVYEDEKGLFWQAKVEVASDPNRVGGIEERRVRILEEVAEGGEKKIVMELRPKQDMLADDGTPTRAVLRWERFE